jgi:hypothetical protein
MRCAGSVFGGMRERDDANSNTRLPTRLTTRWIRDMGCVDDSLETREFWLTFAVHVQVGWA